MKSKLWSRIALGLVVLIAGGLGLAWAYGLFDKSVHAASVGTSHTTQATSADLKEALTLAKDAQAKLHAMKGYRCLYLRDEFIGNEMQENYIKLAIHHEPFSVSMVWIEPKLKKDRKAIYVAGKNDGNMIVKQLFIKKTLAPDESIKMKESRHTILEAGLKNMMDRFVTSWEAESKLSETSCKYFDTQLDITTSGKKNSYDCRVVETDHPVTVKDKYLFYRVKVFFNKADGLPVRMEGYDWPTTVYPEGRLVERYTYVDVKSEDVVPDEFKL
jgi:hypothetical protein